MPPNTVKVDRSTPWGNPFIVSKHGTQARCVELYERLMAGYIALTFGNVKEQQKVHEHVKQHHRDLRFTNLACWCKSGTPCHADVLLRVVKENIQK